MRHSGSLSFRAQRVPEGWDEGAAADDAPSASSRRLQLVRIPLVTGERAPTVGVVIGLLTFQGAYRHAYGLNFRNLN